MKSCLRRGLLLASAVALFLAAAPAAAQIYLETNPPIPGTVVTPGYEMQIAVDSVQYGFGLTYQPCGVPSELSVSEITISKTTGLDSIALATAMRDNAVFQTMTFSFTKDYGGTVRTYQEVVLTDAVVTGYSQSSGGSLPSETVNLGFSKVDVTYFLYDGGGKSIGQNTVTIYSTNCAP